MCIGVPMRVLQTAGLLASCEDGGHIRSVDLSLVGAQPPGTWVLVLHDAARRVLSPEEADAIRSALQALESVLRGDACVDHLFADLADREPPLPEHLRAQVKE